MIFIALGSQKFQFNRLLEQIDLMLEKKEIEEELFAQTGFSSYEPKNYKFKDFLTFEAFNEKISECDTLITHAGTGTIMSGIKQNKRVIVVPRLAKYGEHVDNHQIEICREFEKMGLVLVCWKMTDLSQLLHRNLDINVYNSGNERIQDYIINYINRNRGK